MWNSKIKFVLFDDEDYAPGVDETSVEESVQPVKTYESSSVLAPQELESFVHSAVTADVSGDGRDYAIPRALRGRESTLTRDTSTSYVSQSTREMSSSAEFPFQSQTRSQQTKTEVSKLSDYQALGARPKTTLTVPLTPLSHEAWKTEHTAVRNVSTLTQLCHGMSDLYTVSARADDTSSSSFSPYSFHIKTTAKANATSSTFVTSKLCLTPRQNESCFVDTSVRTSGSLSRLSVLFRDTSQHVYTNQQPNLASQPRYFMVAGESDLQKLQYEALGARPRTAVVPITRRQLSQGDLNPNCNFCKRNGEPPGYYSSHNLEEGGRIICPVLRRYVCPLCGATEERAHTISYCPLWSGNSPTSVIRTRRQACGCLKGRCRHVKENSD